MYKIYFAKSCIIKIYFIYIFFRKVRYIRQNIIEIYLQYNWNIFAIYLTYISMTPKYCIFSWPKFIHVTRSKKGDLRSKKIDFLIMRHSISFWNNHSWGAIRNFLSTLFFKIWIIEKESLNAFGAALISSIAHLINFHFSIVGPFSRIALHKSHIYIFFFSWRIAFYYFNIRNLKFENLSSWNAKYLTGHDYFLFI